jgi:2-keto-3-deoxy-L-rhamnonate aldolase RhmA
MASPAKVQALREKMKRGEVVAAVNVGGRNPDIVEHLARLGADVAFIDCERTGIGLDVATELIRAARAADLPAVVRSWSRAPEALVRYLDRKADGIVVPHVDTPEEAASIVELVRYACGDAAASKLAIVQIETPKAVAAVDAMAAVPGVDVFLLGPNDLSYEMTGKRGARTPEVNAAIEHVCARLRHAGRAYGMPARGEEIAKFRALGATFLYYPVEWLLESGLQALARETRG